MPIKGVKLGADLDLEVGRSSGLRSTLKSHLATSITLGDKEIWA